MKNKILYLSLISLLSSPILAQQNNTLRGKMLWLNSNKTPAVGVGIAGSIKEIKANKVYTAENGTYQLVFPSAQVGNMVSLEIGDKDKKGKRLEVVNQKEINICRVPAKATDEFPIIVCRKGERDEEAQQFYGILKTSSDIALERKKKEMDRLLAQSTEDYMTIAEYGKRITELEKQADSITIYKEALRLASINRDFATNRVQLYLAILKAGRSIQEARAILNIEKAAEEADRSIESFWASIEELETRAGASASIFDYKDAGACYDIILVKLERMGIDRLKVAEYFNETFVMAYKGGQYRKALNVNQRCMEILVATVEQKHPDLASSYNNLALTHSKLGNYKKALEYNKRDIAIKEEVLNPKHPDLANSYNNIAISYSRLGNYKKALEYNKMDIAIKEEILSPRHPDLANSYNSIAISYSKLGNYEKALEYNRMDIAIKEEILNHRHPSLANSYNNISSTYEDLGQYEKALEYNLKDIDIKEEVLNHDHPDLATSFNNIALTYGKLGDYGKALEYNLKDIAIREKILGSKHPSLATSFNAIALTYGKLGDYEKALEYNLKDIAIKEETLGPKHPDLATSFNNIGTTYYSLGLHERALRFILKAVVIREKVLTPTHPDLANSYNNLALTYEKLGNYERALENNLKAIGSIKEILGPKHPILAICYNNISRTYENLGRYEKALENNLKAITIREEILNPKHPDLATSYYSIALTYVKLNDYEKAMEYSLRSNKILKEALPEGHPNLTEVKKVLKAIFRKKGLSHLKQKDWLKANINFTQALKHFVDSEFYIYRGLTTYNIGQFLKAIEDYKKSGELNPDLYQTSLWSYLGTAYVKNKNYPEAKTAFEAYEKLNPQNGSVYRNWAMYHALKGNKLKALENLKKAITLGFDDAEWLETDDSMDSLRKEPVFIQLLEQLKQ